MSPKTFSQKRIRLCNYVCTYIYIYIHTYATALLHVLSTITLQVRKVGDFGADMIFGDGQQPNVHFLFSFDHPAVQTEDSRKFGHYKLLLPAGSQRDARTSNSRLLPRMVSCSI